MTLTFILKGQVMSGKNHMQITRTGRHYPTKRWAAWRDLQVQLVLYTYDAHKLTRPLITTPCSAKIVFTHADKRRRDVPGMLDALCHVLERAGVVKDDSLIVNWDVQTNLPPCRELAGVTIKLETL